MRGYLTNTQKQMAFRLNAQGWSLVDIGRQIGCSAPMIGLMVRNGQFRTGLPDGWSPRKDCLSILEREHITTGRPGLVWPVDPPRIAAPLPRHASLTTPVSEAAALSPAAPGSPLSCRQR